MLYTASPLSHTLWWIFLGSRMFRRFEIKPSASPWLSFLGTASTFMGFYTVCVIPRFFSRHKFIFWLFRDYLGGLLFLKHLILHLSGKFLLKLIKVFPIILIVDLLCDHRINIAKDMGELTQPYWIIREIGLIQRSLGNGLGLLKGFLKVVYLLLTTHFFGFRKCGVWFSISSLQISDTLLTCVQIVNVVLTQIAVKLLEVLAYSARGFP